MTACATPAARPTIPVPANLRQPVEDRPKPDLPAPSALPLAGSAAEERRVIWEVYVKPLMRFSIEQEAVKEAERARAGGAVSLIDEANAAQRPRSWLDRLRWQ